MEVAELEQDLSGDGGVLKVVIDRSGKEGSIPEVGDFLLVSFEAFIFPSNSILHRTKDTLYFVLGKHQIIPGLEIAFQSMRRGEVLDFFLRFFLIHHLTIPLRATFKIFPEYAYGKMGLSPIIPPSSILIAKCELIDFSTKSDSLVTQAQEKRIVGNGLMKNRQYLEASKVYESALLLLQEKSLDPSLNSETSKLELTIKSNLAQCYLNLRDFIKCISLCTQVLEMDSTNAKVQLRRATALIRYECFNEAKSELTFLRENQEISEELRKSVENQIKELHDLKDLGSMKTTYSSYTSSKPNLFVIPLDAHQNTKRVFFIVQNKRFELELFFDSHPKTCENFLQLCIRREKGYLGSKFHRIIPGMLIQGGNISSNGFGSIYGETFLDENLIGSSRHREPFLLSMANAGQNTNGCQFLITTGAVPMLDGKHVCFGRVIDGSQVIKEIEQLELDDHGCPLNNVLIEDCGAVLIDGPTHE